MKNIINKVKNNKIVWLVLGIIVGLIITGSGVYAATIINASNVAYTGSSVGLYSATMQGAIDEAYSNIQTLGIKYAFGDPSSSSILDYMTLVNSGYNVFAALNGTEKSVCIYRNGSLSCFKYNNYSSEATHLTTVFGSSNCYDMGGKRCDDGSYRCTAYSDGSVDCIEYSYYYSCSVGSSISCY